MNEYHPEMQRLAGYIKSILESDLSDSLKLKSIAVLIDPISQEEK